VLKTSRYRSRKNPRHPIDAPPEPPESGRIEAYRPGDPDCSEAETAPKASPARDFPEQAGGFIER